VAVADPGHEVDAAGEEAPDLRRDHRVAKSNVVAGEGVVGGQLGGEDIGHCVHGDRAHRDVAAGEGEIEGQFVQSVPPIEVAEAAGIETWAERSGEGGGQTSDQDLRLVIEQATGTRSPCGQAQGAEEIGVGEVGGLEDLMDEGADPGPAGKLTEGKKAAEQTGVVRLVHSGGASGSAILARSATSVASVSSVEVETANQASWAAAVRPL